MLSQFKKRLLIKAFIWLAPLFLPILFCLSEGVGQEYVPLGTGIPHVYNGIPFEILGAELGVYHDSTGFVPSDTFNLFGYIATCIHVIQDCYYAANVSDGVTVGQVNIYYTDGTSNSLDLVIGQNTAEWSYDRPETQACLQHTPIPPAWSFWTSEGSEFYYWGHLFYASIATALKGLDYLELFLDPASYTGQPDTCGRGDWFGIGIKAITLEVPYGSISGHVRFEDNTPIANVVVQARKGDEQKGSGTTNNEGYYEIENLPSDIYKVRACFDNNGDLVCNYHNSSNPSVEDVEVTAGSETSDIDITFPLPVVMVYGWRGSPAVWGRAKEYFQMDPAIKNDSTKGHICLIPTGFNERLSLVQNGALLADYIIHTYIPKFNPTAPKMNIVAHSMGGLISRVYVHYFENIYRKVDKLTMLGTPNGGFKWLMEFYKYRYRAAKDMTVRSMKEFNRLIPNLGDSRFHLWAGRGDGGAHFLEGNPPRDCPYPYPYSDGVVGEWSVFNCGTRTEYCIPSANHYALHEPPYVNCVLRILEDKQYSSPCHSVFARDNYFSSADDGIQFSPPIVDSIFTGEVKQYQIVIDASLQASFSVNWIFGELDLVLYDPDGFLIDSAVAAGDPDIEYVPFDSMSGLPQEQYTIQNPVSGTWTLEVSAVSTPPDSSVLFFVMANMENNLSLSITTDKEYYAQGEPVLITATLTENASPKTGAVVYARITSPNYSIDSLDLFDDGGHGDGLVDDGVYGNSYTNTPMGGRYSLSVTASGLTSGGDEFARQEILEFDVNPNTAHFTGYYSDQGVDVDGDGYFDSLRIEVGIEIDSAGDYEIVASLIDSNNTEIDIANYGETDLSVGTHTFILDFSGQKIRENGVDGPYYLKNLILVDETEGIIEADFVSDAYTTSPYFVTQFTTSVEEEPIELPKTFALFQSYPNPFNAESNIRYVLAGGCFVKLIIYNILGEKVRVLVNEYQNPGDKIVRWDGKNENGNNVSSGIYFYRLNAGDFTETKKMLLLK